MNATRLIAGAMSGTSADGVDVAITRVEGRAPDMAACLVLHHHRPYDQAVRHRIFQVRGGSPVALRELALLGRDVTLACAAAVNEALLAARLDASQLDCVAAHGQTLYHEPPLTIQWLDPALLAAEVGCAVVSDFRRADCAVGGQGAPLVPFADCVLFRHPTLRRAALNIGGIANLTSLPPCGEAAVLAFDTGPGNCISDWLMRELEPSSGGFDANGARAQRGRLIPGVIQSILSDPYFTVPPPKSTDSPAMIELFLRHLPAAPPALPLEDLLATACALTVRAIAWAIERFVPRGLDQIIVSGGGVANRAIMDGLARQLATVELLTSDDLGIPSAAKEALAFALLAAATLDGIPANVPSATGATRSAILGSITPRP